MSISERPTKNITCASGVCSATAKNAVLNVTDLANMLSTGDVSVVSGSSAVDITFAAPISWTSSSRLTLDAYRSIAFERPVVVAGPGAMTIKTNDGGSGGDFQFSAKSHVEFWDLSSSLIINNNSYKLFNDMHALVDYLSGGAPGFYALARGLSARKTYPHASIETLEGLLEGLGNTISNLSIADPSRGDYVGLVGMLVNVSGTSATIRDLRLKKVNISASGSENRTGAVVGDNRGSIIHVFVSGQVSDSDASSFVGGLVGNNEFGSISQSGSDADVIGSGNAGVGGIAGLAVAGCAGSCSGSIDQSYSIGTVNGGDGAMVGGLVGQNLGSVISNSFAAGSVSGGNNAFVGGLVGSNNDDISEQSVASISASYSYGPVSGGSGATLGG